MSKADGAFLTIGELAQELGVPQHVLRYWETRFSQLKPLQRSGNRRYYRPADVDIARRIHGLLNVEGFTIRGAQRVLTDKGGAIETSAVPLDVSTKSAAPEQTQPTSPDRNDSDAAFTQSEVRLLIARLTAIRDLLGDALIKR